MKSAKGKPTLPARVVIAGVCLYRKYVSPHTPPSCRYVPSCSEYAVISISRYGFVKGTWLAFRRIVRCNPWNPGGFDPVP